MTYVRRERFKPSPQQADYFREITKGKGSMILEAVAGSGKTTTLVHGLSFMDGNIFFGAYNKAIAEEIKRKAEEERVNRKGIFITTMHGAGFLGWRSTYPNVIVDDGKVSKIISEFKDKDQAFYLRLDKNITFVRKMVSFAKHYLIGVNLPNVPDEWLKLMEFYSIDESLPDGIDINQAIADCMLVFELSKQRCNAVIDFDDMLYAPCAFNTRLFKNDWVLIDEAQDTNPARLELASRVLARHGRLVAVGDSRQAIYGFSGAMSDALELIARKFGCRHLPLSVSYRCPKKVVEYVQQWVQHIQASSTAIDGEVRSVTFDPRKIDEQRKAPMPWFLQDPPDKTSAIFCRYTKPLVATAFAMLRCGIACKIEGRDIGKSIIDLAKRWKVKSLEALDNRLSAYLIREVQASQKSKSEKRATEAADKVDTVRVFMARARDRGETTIDGIEADVNALFADNINGMITLATGHKAKGREWPTVFWIQTGQRRQLKTWEVVQEENLKYVIGTRSQNRLIFVPEALVIPKKQGAPTPPPAPPLQSSPKKRPITSPPWE